MHSLPHRSETWEIRGSLELLQWQWGMLPSKELIGLNTEILQLFLQARETSCKCLLCKTRMGKRWKRKNMSNHARFWNSCGSDGCRVLKSRLTDQEMFEKKPAGIKACPPFPAIFMEEDSDIWSSFNVKLQVFHSFQYLFPVVLLGISCST